MATNRYQYIYFFVLLSIALALMFWVIKPFIVAIFVAMVCYVLFKDYHDRLERKVVSKNLAAFIAVLSVVLLIIIPLCIITVLVFFEARDLYNSLAVNVTPDGVLSQGVLRMENNIHTFLPNLNLDVQTYVRASLDWLISHTSAIFTGFLNFLIQLIIMLFALFYLFKEGKQLRTYIIRFSPLDEQDDSNILNKLELTVNSVIRGSLIVGLIQGVLTAIGFTIFGIGQPVLWGLIAAFASLIPGVGTSLVSVPAIIFLLLSGRVVSAIGYGIWAAIAVGTIDNFLGPYFIKSRVNIHPFLILISVLGGLVLFGPIGFLAGPITLAFATELVKLYPKFIHGHD